MRGFFAFDGPFVRVMTQLVDMIILTIVFLVCCIPVFTIGASWSALYYATHKVVRYDRGYVIKEFFHAFKENFKQSTIVWLIMLLIYGVLGTECYLMYQYALKGQQIGMMYYPLMVLIALVILWNLYLFPYISRFNNETKVYLSNAVKIAVANALWSILLLALFVLFFLFIVAWPGLLFIVPGAYMYVAEHIIERVFQKYMTEDDKAEEMERNREYKN